MKNLVKIAAMATLGALVATGCSTSKGLFGKFDNGSLDYRHAKKLEPIQLPADQPAAPFLPLYNAPDSVSNVPEYANESGKQYALPKPPNAIR